MAAGYYTTWFESAINPYTTLGPLSIVISLSLLVQGLADKKRHKSDNETNNAPCVILRRGEEIDNDEEADREKTILNGNDVVVNLSKSYALTSTKTQPNTPVTTSTSKKHIAKIGFQKIKRMDIRQGHIVLVKNREMVPADMILLASSGDNGSTYIETSSIDGETNLKLRTSPHLPKNLLKRLRSGRTMEEVVEEAEEEDTVEMESLEQATKRIARFSVLAYPNGVSSMEHSNYNRSDEEVEDTPVERRSFFNRMNTGLQNAAGRASTGLSLMTGQTSGIPDDQKEIQYIAALRSEPPNPHVNTFSGLLVLPPIEVEGTCHEIPLGAENILLRGAVVRNTEWVLGLACFTGTDTKLAQNSFETPSKFSQLDVLMNKTVIFILAIMFIVISSLATMAVIANKRELDNLW
jgi:magnesium-transporting ATPase (P-type)